MSGTVRMLTRAQALSTMMFRASLRELAWIAFTVKDGWRQFVSRGCRPPNSCTPSSIPACLRKSSASPGSDAIAFRSASLSGFTFS